MQNLEKKLTEDVSNEKASDIITAEDRELLSHAIRKLKDRIDSLENDKLNVFDYMNPTTMEFFIAELYCNEFEYPDLWDKESNNTIMLENVIGASDGNNGIEDSIEPIMVILKDYYGMDTTERDRVIIRLIAYSNERHSMHYYISKAEEFLRLYSLEISEFKRLDAIEKQYWDDNIRLGAAFIDGRDAYCMNERPEENAEYTAGEDDLKEAWLNGYCWSQLDCKLNEAILLI